jgi:hypothetical protein
MIAALKLLGLAFLGGAILLVLGIAFLIWFVRRWFRRAIQQEESIVPTRVSLTPEPQPQWKNGPQIESYAGQLREHGFSDNGAFQIPELRGLLISAFSHPERTLFAVIYDYQQMAPTVDVWRKFTDGTGVTATNTIIGEDLDQRPTAKTYRIADASVPQLLEAVTSHKNEASPVAHLPENFVSLFQESYLESATWRLQRGGVTKDEIRRHAVRKGTELTEEQLNEAWETQRRQYRRQVQEGCIAQFLDESKMSAAEWEKISDRVIVLAETYELVDIVESLDIHLFLDEEQRHVLEKSETTFGETGIHVAEKILSTNLAGLNLTKLGDVQLPVRALLVRVPDSNISAKAA